MNAMQFETVELGAQVARRGVYVALLGAMWLFTAPEVVSAAAPASAQYSDEASTPHAAIVPEKLHALGRRAEAAGSDALIVMQDGKVVFESYFGKPRRPIELMSATKSIVSLAVGKLIETGKITSLDQPVCEFFPEWRQGRKQRITIRHLLNHTSGLQGEANASDIYDSSDFVRLALAAELSDEPGTVFFYNNKAVNLLAGVVERASGSRLDAYTRDTIFTPLGITEFEWMLDPAGNPHGMSGLRLHARDMAKIGQMLLDDGVYDGKQVVSREWIRLSALEPGQSLTPRCGLLWWRLSREERIVLADDALISQWNAAGADASFVERISTLKGREYDSKESALGAIREVFGGEEGLKFWQENTGRGRAMPWRRLPTPLAGFAAEGFLGQYLVVLPGERIVAVRQLGPTDPDVDMSTLDSLDEFTDLVLGLTQE